MEIEIREIDSSNYGDIDQVGASFWVDSRLKISAADSKISYVIEPVDPGYTKHYKPEDLDYTSDLSHPDKTIFFAYTGGQLAGQIILRVNWNKLTYVDDISVKDRFRKQGIGRALMQRAVEWALERETHGIMLETSDINVPACRFYSRFGFELGGFDRLLYHATMPGSEEIALYWYLLFK